MIDTPASNLCRMLRRLRMILGAVLAAVALALTGALPAWAAQSITLTWVRHAESTANAAGVIDTRIPGPGLTALGDTQAQTIAATLAANADPYDGIVVSDMQRTGLTAAPLAAGLGLTPVVAGGVREIDAGIFEGQGGVLAGIGYALPPLLWTLGARFVPVLGGENGNGFDARVDAAVATILGAGDINPVVFSHGATIMAWTLMNVTNPDLLLAVTHPLGNTDVVVVTGNPEDGWVLDSWDGITVDSDPGLLTKLFVDARALVVAPQTSLYALGQALRTGDPATVLAAARDGILHVVSAACAFGKAVIRDVAGAISGLVNPSSAASVRPAAARQDVLDATEKPSVPALSARAALGATQHAARTPSSRSGPRPASAAFRPAAVGAAADRATPVRTGSGARTRDAA